MKWPLLILLLVSACQSHKLSPQQYLDSLKKAEYVDSFVKARTKEMNRELVDSSGSYAGPIRVLNASIDKADYGSERNINLTIKNVSKQKIEAVKFQWYCVDAFGEPCDMGSGFDGIGYGLYDEQLSPGETKTITWSAHAGSARRIETVSAYEVALEDGKVWKLNK